MNKKRFTIVLVMALLVVGGILLTSCAQPTPETVVKTVVVTEVVEGEPVEVVKTVVVTPEVVEPGAVEFKSKDPTTFVDVTGAGDTDTLDPAWNYESAGDAVIQNIYDQLVTYNGADATSFVPSLAESWEISEDGMTYVFHIRQGVKFHEGQDLTPEDVAYTLQRGILQGGGWSPQWLYTEALFGTGV
ncbi:MAG TPA: hypothetical protein G4N95_08790, partial [Anaerolineae bacterium]|nr:hypothetical protein [Anaerolineae bacterium]